MTFKPKNIDFNYGSYRYTGKNRCDSRLDILEIQLFQPMTLEQIIKQVYKIAIVEDGRSSADILEDIINEIETNANQLAKDSVQEMKDEKEEKLMKKEQLETQIRQLQTQLEAAQEELNSL